MARPPVTKHGFAATLFIQEIRGNSDANKLRGLGKGADPYIYIHLRSIVIECL